MKNRTIRPEPTRGRPLRRAVPSVLATLALLLTTALAALPAQATPTAEPGVERQLQPVVVVMDYSSSMLEADADADGTTRLAAAQQATTNLLDNVPEGADLGLVVYGSNTPEDCSDITTVQQVGPTDAASLKQRIEALEAVGETPIGAALLHAADELQDVDGEKSIILVSDGEENCSEPPACEAAKDLAGQGIDLTVHTIGFKVNETAADELTCVAEATGGTYVQADNAVELESRLKTKTVRAFQGYNPLGTPITGGETLHSSPTMAPGQYLDEYERGSSTLNSDDGTLKFYNLGTIQPGERAHFSALLIPNQGAGADDASVVGGLRLQLVNGQGQPCSAPQNEYVHGDDGGRPVVAYVVSEDYTDDSSRCYADGTGQLYAKVQRYGNRQADLPMPVELKSVVEPAVDEADLVAAAKDELAPQSVELSGEPEAVLGGGSFNDATEMEQATVLTDSIMPQEARYYRVHVGYGQRLNVRASQGNVENAGPNGITLDIFSAVRGPVRMVGDGRMHRSSGGDTVTQNMRVPVSQSNRDGSVGDDAYLSGDYYVVVSAEKWSNDRNRSPYDYDLAVEVTGDEVDGPQIAEPGLGQSPEQLPVAADAEATGNDDGAAAGGPAGDGDASDEGQPVATGSVDRASAPMPWFLGGLLATVLLGGLTITLWARRRPVGAGVGPHDPHSVPAPAYPAQPPTHRPTLNGHDQNGHDQNGSSR